MISKLSKWGEGTLCKEYPITCKNFFLLNACLLAHDWKMEVCRAPPYLPSYLTLVNQPNCHYIFSNYNILFKGSVLLPLLLNSALMLRNHLLKSTLYLLGTPKLAIVSSADICVSTVSWNVWRSERGTNTPRSVDFGEDFSWRFPSIRAGYGSADT